MSENNNTLRKIDEQGDGDTGSASCPRSSVDTDQIADVTTENTFSISINYDRTKILILWLFWLTPWAIFFFYSSLESFNSKRYALLLLGIMLVIGYLISTLYLLSLRKIFINTTIIETILIYGTNRINIENSHYSVINLLFLKMICFFGDNKKSVAIFPNFIKKNDKDKLYKFLLSVSGRKMDDFNCAYNNKLIFLNKERQKNDK